ncbi:MAG: hypothetical protein D6751_05510 [Deltaproteobacteria bacterium]|nr:MAG: hypothetical protein D6751_05510 [Deltaproteobacteria bacterium]
MKSTKAITGLQREVIYECLNQIRDAAHMNENSICYGQHGEHYPLHGNTVWRLCQEIVKDAIRKAQEHGVLDLVEAAMGSGYVKHIYQIVKEEQ